MKRTLVLYQYPEALPDIWAWYQRAKDSGSLRESTHDPIRPVFSMVAPERVECYPLEDLNWGIDHLLNPSPWKVVVVGAITRETRVGLIQLLSKME